MIRRLALAVAAAILVLLAIAAPASASPGPRWDVGILTDTSAAPGAEFEYIAELRNSGDAPFSGETVLTVQLPVGITAVAAQMLPNALNEPESESPCTAGDGFSPVSGAESVRCASTVPLAPSANSGTDEFQLLHLRALVAAGTPEAEAPLTATFTASGGTAPTVTSVAPIHVAAAPPGFGIAAFDALPFVEGGEASTRAGAHPAGLAVALGFNTHEDTEFPTFATGTPVEPFKDAFTELPAGFIANPAAVESCTAAELAHAEGQQGKPLCPSGSQVGTARISMNNGSPRQALFGPVAVYSLDPPVGSPARLGMNVGGVLIVIDAALRGNDGYRIEVGSKDASEAFSIGGVEFDFWGTPASPTHEIDRSCPGESPTYAGGPPCPSTVTAENAFFRNPTSCQDPGEGVSWDMHADSWLHPGAFRADGTPELSDTNWKSLSIRSHNAPGYPYAPSEWGPEAGFEQCEAEPFNPRLEGGPPAGTAAGEPSSFSFDLKMPQQGLEEPEAISESDLRKTVVTLPAGVRLNPASADGLASCTPAQVALATPVGQADAHFRTEQAACPESSKIGTLKIKTPLLDHEIPGAVYLAQPEQNPFGSLIALYLVAKDPVSGVDLVLPGRVDLDPATGQITTTFDNNPQLPFEDLRLELKSGPRAALRAPSDCGAYAIKSIFTGWSGKSVEGESTFAISEGCTSHAFDPKLDAGTQNPLAGTTSPFNLRLSREDGTQELSGLAATLPPGLTGYLKGIPYCPDSALASVSSMEGTGVAQEQSPSCPAASRLGRVTVGAGAGPDPFFTSSGRAYLAGPYKGAPLSLAVVAPAVAGPFDLGSVVVRNALRVNPETAQITAVTDPLPSILHGIPLDLRDVRVELDRPHFTLNPTSCEPMEITSLITSTQGQAASPSDRFQVAGCDRLAFKPKLSIHLKGKTKRSGHPGLRATLTMPASGSANIARATVSLPHSEFLDNAHIRGVCTRVQYAEGGGGGAACPKGSVYGHAVAYSPLLGAPLEGNLYLRSNGGERTLPDLVASLNGQIHVDLVGYVDSNKRTGGLRTSFATVPDAPVEKFVLAMPAGRRSLLENSTGICRGTHRAIVQVDAHNGKLAGSRVKLGVAACKDRGRRKGGHR